MIFGKIKRWFEITAAQERPFKFLLSRLLMRSGISRFLKINRGAFSVYFFPSALSAQIWLNPAARSDDEEFAASFLKRGETFVDIGANIGLITLAGAKAAGAGGRVLSVEPDPDVFSYLRRNIRLNKLANVSVFNCAIGAAPGKLYLKRSNADDENAVDFNSGHEIEVRTLDEIAGGAGQIALLKVDVEGFEKYVFEGGKAVLKRTECVYFEAWEKHYSRYNYSFADIFGLLAGHGFQLLRAGNPADGFLNCAYVPARCENIIAVRSKTLLEKTIVRAHLKSHS
ncbi:MAG: FkbM family methyltransferase [Elusimicrobiales bacterium]|nr:FkbM family methyltransferase [Elusimicrobiales bacterium]